MKSHWVVIDIAIRGGSICEKLRVPWFLELKNGRRSETRFLMDLGSVLGLVLMIFDYVL
jgi:hypothetical protein